MTPAQQRALALFGLTKQAALRVQSFKTILTRASRGMGRKPKILRPPAVKAPRLAPLKGPSPLATPKATPGKIAFTGRLPRPAGFGGAPGSKPFKFPTLGG